MLAPEIGSTNADTSDKTPLVSQNVFKRLSSLFGRSPSTQPTGGNDGYVEFGSMTEQSDNRTLGSFAGVFSPVTLSMFSALIFLRVGYLVGNAGLMVTLLQFFIAYTILIFTVASICAISTNGAVEGGGAYFMISRTLGPEFGGSIGTLFFLANIVNSALNISGCVEGLVENIGPGGYLISGDGLIPDGRWYRFLYCSGLNGLNLIVCLIGAGMFAKTTVFILATVVVCTVITVISFFVQNPMQVTIPDANTLVQNISHYGNFTGLRSETIQMNLWPHYGKDYTAHGEDVTFASVFAVLFSGVTGIMAGANMSGELKNPGKAIPHGTLSAVLFTLVVYLCLSILTAASSDTFLLQNNYLFMAGISVFPASVAVGLITATWSAALSNAIGASRVLEALTKDRVFGSALDFIPKGTWRNNPLVAVLISCLLVEFVLLIGSLNLIAQLNSVLFLLSYLATNLACLGLELASAPNFRPSFKYFTWYTAFVGLIGTLVMMFVISPIYAACSILLCLILVVMLHLFSPSKEAQWGSISQALIFHQVRKYLLLLDSRKDHVKFWRPQVLLLVNSPRSTCPLIDFINDLKKGGLYVLGHVVKGEDYAHPDPTLEMIPHWLTLVDHLKVKAFVELTVATSVRDGLQHLMRLSGMGAMKPNTVVLGFLDEKQDSKDFLQSSDSPYVNREFENDIFPLQSQMEIGPVEYVQMISDVLRMNKNICLCRNFSNINTEWNKNNDQQYIDVWPINFLNPTEKDAFDTTSLFMMQLACIVNSVPKWKKLTLRICVCDEVRQTSFSLSNPSVDSYTDKLSHLLKMLRISAKMFVVSGWTQVFDSHSSSVDAYLDRVNELIVRHSGTSVITFLYLPMPPTEADTSVTYLKMLDSVSKNMPPVIFVHGVSTVTSTTL
ncbi:hypothetical protein RN001_008468 [Aquatica leii]|uniref:Solute carrier family 12 member 9 n=1 Tax=Aquatica leii TaxID=1421715 RepID=A0AAN7SGS5_9COLE|nr:hypothetical protein RN001_008468 [Aquatica leii]